MFVKRFTLYTTLALALLFNLSISLPAYAEKVCLSIDPNNDSLPLNYKIHYGTSSRNYTSEIDLGSPKLVDSKILGIVDSLQPGKTYYFAATSYNEHGESNYSNEMQYTIQAPAQSDFAVEVGEIGVSSSWKHITFDTAFTNPVVVAKAGSMNNPDPITIAISNVTKTGFDIRIKEWYYLDGNHPQETIFYMAMEQGVHKINNNFQASAQCFNIPGSNTYMNVAFPSSFSTLPVVLSSVVTENGKDPNTLRMRNISKSNFSVALQEQEKNDGFHVPEKACYIAMDQWNGIANDLMIEVGTTSKIVTHAPTKVTFRQQFPEIPMTLSDMQTADGGDTAVLGMQELSLTTTKLAVIEEKSLDSEIYHVAESSGYIAVVSYDPNEDSDNDGLSNQKELSLKTHPGLADTDDDGINDGKEYNYWLSISIDPSADSDGDGIINILDRDSDNDGVSDGIEIAQNSNPAGEGQMGQSNDLTIEIGEVSIDHNKTRVTFDLNYNQPVVIANSITESGADPYVVRISNVDSKGFDIQLQEHAYLDGGHMQEKVTYIVLEKGSYALSDGTQLEAGLFNTSATSFLQQAFINKFKVSPVVLSSIQTTNDPEAVLGRIRKISTTGFDYQLQEQEASDQLHSNEKVAYLAWSPGSGTVDGIQFEAGKTSNSVTQNPYSISFKERFTDLPFHFAGMQTTNGYDTALIKIQQAKIGSMEVLVEEEASHDSETSHVGEEAGYLIILP